MSYYLTIGRQLNNLSNKQNLLHTFIERTLQDAGISGVYEKVRTLFEILAPIRGSTFVEKVRTSLKSLPRLGAARWLKIIYSITMKYMPHAPYIGRNNINNINDINSTHKPFR